jgi:hypothetical protein
LSGIFIAKILSFSQEGKKIMFKKDSLIKERGREREGGGEGEGRPAVPKNSYFIAAVSPCFSRRYHDITNRPKPQF